MRHREILAGAAFIWALEFICCGSSAAVGAGKDASSADALEQDVTQGALRVEKGGTVVECPLKHTDVKAQISGFIARVTVTQTFANPYDEKIEAVYVFPLPHKAAVDDMTMVIGDRRIVGLIKRRAEAREIYEQALAHGAAAALLEQERPNIFTQSVGNIPPKQEVRIEISYVDVLDYDMGTYSFHFPMVVGPRYIPGGATSAIAPVPPELQGKVGELDKNRVAEGPDKPKGTGWAPDTTRVPDASRITPPVLKPGFRNGHDISLSVTLDAGVPIRDLKSPNHQAQIERQGGSRATAVLPAGDSIPNKDFVLTYGVVGEKPEMAVLGHTDGKAGYFMLMIQPREDEQLKKSPPRELVFLVDVSGSMSGAPTEKVKETMAKLLRLCKPQDMVQVITFESQSRKLFEKPIPCTGENIEKAVNFTQSVSGGGGTEMLKGIRLAIDEPLDKERMRIVILLTDGFIGNEAEIIAAVGRGCGDRIRFWCIGIGSSPNRFLLDGVARQGGGMAKVVGLNQDAGETAEDIMTRIHRAQLANIRIDWGGVRVTETYPAKIPELWAGRPVVLYGLYGNGGQEATLTVSGDVEGTAVSWPLKVTFPQKEPANDVLAKVWARNKIEDLMQQTYYAGSPEVEELVTDIALEYRLMSQYTSFVAVDEKDAATLKTPARPPRRMLVPVPLPEGVQFEGIFGAPGKDMDALETGAKVDASKLAAKSQFSPKFKQGVSKLYARRDRGARQVGGWSSAAMPSATPRAPATMAPANPAPVNMPMARAMSSPVEEAAEPFADPETAARPSGYGYFADVVQAQGGAIERRAQSVLKRAQNLRTNDVAAARSQFVLSYLLDTAAGNSGQSAGDTAAASLRAIQEIDRSLATSWQKDVPALGKTLDLVIRDRPISETLYEVSQAAGIPIQLVRGSLVDASVVMNSRDVRITYLDLRHATVAQALDWILLPNRMNWWVSKGSVFAGASRRAPGESAWVYDVSLLVIPSDEEMKGVKDSDRATKTATKSADEFRKAVAKALSLKDDALAWYGPGLLLVFADEGTHTAAASLFHNLATPAATVEPGLVELQKVASRRAAVGQGAADKWLAALERSRTLHALDSFSWRLLSAAARGRLDVEALTEIQVAWKRAETAKLVMEHQGAVVARSAWSIVEAARLLPKERELTDLASTAQDVLRKAADAAADALKKSPQDSGTFARSLYLAMALGGDADYAARIRPLLEKSGQEQQAIAAALLSPDKDVNGKALADVVAKGVQGDDMVMLAALACRRVGGDTWNAFRAGARDLLGNQPLSGGVVVAVNSLAGSPMH